MSAPLDQGPFVGGSPAPLRQVSSGGGKVLAVCCQPDAVAVNIDLQWSTVRVGADMEAPDQPLAETPGSGPGSSPLADLAGSAPVPLSLAPGALTLWRGGSLVVTFVVVGITAVLGVLADGTDLPSRFGPAMLFLLIGLTVSLVVPAAQYRRWRYWLTEDEIEIRHGLVVRNESSIPHFRVQHIDIRQGPLQRLVGVVKLEISTASPASDAELPGITPDQAERIRRLVLERAEADDAV